MKFVLMFFTFLSVCTTAELLQIPLTLDSTRTIKIPKGLTNVSETITVSPSEDPDFQKYLDKIKGYTIESVSIRAANSVSRAGAAITDLYVEFPAYNFTTGKTNLLYDGKEIILDINGDTLVKLAESIQKNGSMVMKLNGYTYSLTGEDFDFKIEINLKIKV